MVYMQYFLVSFLAGDQCRIDVLVHEYEDVSLLEAWYTIRDYFLDDEADIDELIGLLTIASESDDPYEAFKSIDFKPSFCFSETVKIIEITELSDIQYRRKCRRLDSDLNTFSNQMDRYLLDSLNKGIVTLVVQTQASQASAANEG